ncbi:hypothetical protein C8F04DRAFT_1176463 [Mycena alexandri]|uniref:N-acetyltransferase domain-containing protein n=1 Tax=Mycena alexandri TaxID=1745969 RepID=A0AAD6XA46_9AGAR|nr:hypothetical protein C8F04DRAFT_1176463 [Mycena alexandri]
MSDIYIRQFCPSDFPQASLLAVKGSVASVVRRRFLFKVPSIIAYLLIGAGLAFAWKLPPAEWMSATGVSAAALIALGCTMFVVLRSWLTRSLREFCENVLAGDMRDIPTYCTAIIADLKPGEEESEEVLGCVALGSSMYSEYLPKTDARVAEIRRMLVSVKHRRHGLASRLILETIRHAETMPGVESIKLSTSEFQPGAQLYTRAWVGSVRRPIATESALLMRRWFGLCFGTIETTLEYFI